MAEANAAFLRGRAQVYRRLARVQTTSDSAEDMIKLAELWEAEAEALDADQLKQAATVSIRRQPKPAAHQSILKQPLSGGAPFQLSTVFTLKTA